MPSNPYKPTQAVNSAEARTKAFESQSFPAHSKVRHITGLVAWVGCAWRVCALLMLRFPCPESLHFLVLIRDS